MAEPDWVRHAAFAAVVVSPGIVSLVRNQNRIFSWLFIKEIWFLFRLIFWAPIRKDPPDLTSIPKMPKLRVLLDEMAWCRR